MASPKLPGPIPMRADTAAAERFIARGRLFAFSEVGCVIILNFTHPLTPEQVSQIQALSEESVERTVEIPTQFDNQAEFLPQVAALTDACGLTPAEWQTMPLVIVPPALELYRSDPAGRAPRPDGILSLVRPDEAGGGRCPAAL